jgi:hypothetical protein
VQDLERQRSQIIATVGVIANLLVKGEYGTVESMTHGRLLTADHLRQAVRDCGEVLASHPASALADLDVIQAPEVTPPTFHVVFDLWTEVGRSDLTLELQLTEVCPGILETQILNLHVQ